MIFSYEDYRSFIRSYISQRPRNGFGESKKMATHLGISPTFFSQILSGLKQLSAEQANVLAEYMGLGDLEAEYLFYLVSRERAGTYKLKNFFEKKLAALKDQSFKIQKRINFVKIMSDEEKSIFYSSPLFAAVSLYTSTKKSGVTLEEIEERFSISRRKSSEVMRFLTQTGLCLESSGSYSMGTQSTHVGQDSPHLIKHHTNWRLRAIQAAENLDERELMYTVQVSLSRKDFALLREEMVQFIQRFLEKVYPSPAEEIANLNLDWFYIRK